MGITIYRGYIEALAFDAVALVAVVCCSHDIRTCSS